MEAVKKAFMAGARPSSEHLWVSRKCTLHRKVYFPAPAEPF